MMPGVFVLLFCFSIHAITRLVENEDVMYFGRTKGKPGFINGGQDEIEQSVNAITGKRSCFSL